jgi:hypothetical protein
MNKQIFNEQTVPNDSHQKQELPVGIKAKTAEELIKMAKKMQDDEDDRREKLRREREQSRGCCVCGC